MFPTGASGNAYFHASVASLATGALQPIGYYNALQTTIDGSTSTVTLAASDRPLTWTWLPTKEILRLSADQIRTTSTQGQDSLLGSAGIDMQRIRLPVIQGDRYQTFSVSFVGPDLDGDGIPDVRTTTIEVLVGTPEGIDGHFGHIAAAVPVSTIATTTDRFSSFGTRVTHNTRIEWFAHGLGIVRTRFDDGGTAVSEDLVGLNIGTVRAGLLGPLSLLQAWRGATYSNTNQDLGRPFVQALADGRFVVMSRTYDFQGSTSVDKHGTHAAVLDANGVVLNDFDVMPPQSLSQSSLTAAFGFNGNTLVSAIRLASGGITGFATDLSGHALLPTGGVALSTPSTLEPNAVDSPSSISTVANRFLFGFERNSGTIPATPRRQFVRWLDSNGNPTADASELPVPPAMGALSMTTTDSGFLLGMQSHTRIEGDYCSTSDLYGLRLDMQGAAIDTAPFPLSTSPSGQLDPLLSFGPAGLFVGWTDLRRFNDPFCSSVGQVADTYASQIVAGANSTSPPRLASETFIGSADTPAGPVSVGVGSQQVYLGWAIDFNLTDLGSVQLRALNAGSLTTVDTITLPNYNTSFSGSRAGFVSIGAGASAWLAVWRDQRSGEVRGAVIHPPLAP